MAEIELSLLFRQCLSSRMADRNHLTQGASVWGAERNAIKGSFRSKTMTKMIAPPLRLVRF